MSGRGHVVEWVETTEEVVASEESPPDTGDPAAVLTVTGHAETPIHKLLDTMVQGDDPEADDGFYCVECRALFRGQLQYHGIDGPSFILDSPTAAASPQRALLTLPHGLMIGRSSIPGAGLGVVNQGPTVCPGMHFGPYEGEPTTREAALQSHLSWEISKGKDEYEYIDAARDSHSNWMRYVNCARSEEENNLLAVQYKDSILFHCCRSIQPGDELMVWPSGRLLAGFSPAWTQAWFLRCTPSESNTAVVSQIFLCALCPLSFTTEAYLQRHTDHFHSQPIQDCATEQPGHPTPADTDDPQASLLVLTIDPAESKTCSECGRTFKHVHHLKRHKLSVHSNERPYCCTQCRRCFSQASGLLRHQLVHKKQSLGKPQKMVERVAEEACRVAMEESEPTGAEDPAGDEAQSVRLVTDTSPNLAQEDPDTSPNIPQEDPDTSPNIPQQDLDTSPNVPQEEIDTSLSVPKEEADSDPDIPRESSDEQSYMCSHCDKIFTCEGSLTKHKRSVHSKIRPYVCTLCLQGFRQYSDLTRHLKTHQKGKGRRRRKAGGTSETFVSETFVTETFVSVHCDTCLLTFSSEDSLQDHLSQHHSEETPQDNLQRHLSQHHPEDTPQGAPVDDGERSTSPSPSDGHRDLDPDFTVPPSVPAAAESTRRPQRLGARSKISALIQMIAPKRRLSGGGKKTPRGPAQTEEGCGEVEAPAASTQTGGDVTPAKHGRYGCSRCEGTYRSQADLRAHECTKKQHSCAQCSSTFKTSGFLKRHERMVHSVATPYTCERCNRTFSKVCTLKQHQKANRCEKHHCSSELFRCPFCQFSFTMKSYLRKHIKRHHPVEYLSHADSDLQMCELGEEEAGESYNCPHCGKTYVNAKYFKAHMCFKQVRILYLCTDCGKGFANHYGLRQHQRIHTGEKPYSCPHCSKSFSYMGQVNVHIRTHTGEKPYLCTHCGESFRQSGDLKRHERKHTGVRPYSCPEAGCFKSFSRPQSLKAHQMLHLGQRMFKCTQCGKSFSRNYHLRRHHQKMHS